MANKITITSTLTLSAQHARPSMSFTLTFDQIGSNYTMETQTIGFGAGEALDVGGDIGTIGFLLIQNLDITNYVEFALDSGMTNKIAKLLPGEGGMLPLPAGSTVYAKANVGAVQIAFLAIER